MSHPLQPQLQSISRSIFINHTPGILTITDANTTIGYCRYNESGEIEYIFVNSAFRRKGHAKQLLKIIEARLQCSRRCDTDQWRRRHLDQGLSIGGGGQ